MYINQQSPAQKKVDELYECLSRRRGASPFGSCPVDLSAAFVRLCLAQSCGKCVPCRVGLERLASLLEKILDKKGTMEDLHIIKVCAESIHDSADCAIGFEAAQLVLDGLKAFEDDYISHIEKGVCTESFAAVPCSAGCPAHVDVPGYMALVKAGRYADAVSVIRKDNPFPCTCGLICEHPCENHCRRQLVDASLSIRGIKRYAVEHAGEVPAPACAPANGKTVAVIGGGPAGLTAAYFLRLKGFDVTVFEKRKRLGGMLRYGIPAYRLPDQELDWDINAILSTGVKVEYEKTIGKDVSFEEIRNDYDAVFLSIGAHGASHLGCEGEDAQGVLYAVDLLGDLGEGNPPDFTGKRVVVVGGGNVAMDATRTSIRLGAESVTCVYRRRIEDMTALPEEVAGAAAEGCEIRQLVAPVRVETENDRVVGFTVQPQITGPIQNGRPLPQKADEPEETIPCDIVIIAIGQAIDSDYFANAGVETKRNRIVAELNAEVANMDGVFAGGDCYTGPATVIRAIDAGKVAADSIERHFGLHVPISCDVEIPLPDTSLKLAWGRVNTKERLANERKNDLEMFEYCMTDEEAKQECSRCLRCDHYGYGGFRGGRVREW